MSDSSSVSSESSSEFSEISERQDEVDPFVPPLQLQNEDIPSNLSLKAIYSSVHQKFSYDPTDQNNEENSTFETKTIQGPIQLIKVTDSGTFEVCKKGAEFLKGIKTKIGVVSIGGPTRSGKSFIMNLLSNGSGSGFEVGSKVAACTQGIWIWGEPMQATDMSIIFLDSEGCKSVEKSANHDAKIFSLLILLSSVFIYNSKGVIDEQAINQLSFAAVLSELISTRITPSDSDEEIKRRLAALCPKFIWLLRDFHLSLVDEEDIPISSKQYMDKILANRISTGRSVEKYNKIREAILETFTDRDCITLPRPVDQEKQLENLSEFDLDSLRPKFKKSFEQLQYSALEHCPHKKFDGLEIQGSNLVTFLYEMVKEINDGIAPNINTAWSQVIKLQYEELMVDIKKRYIKARDVEIQHLPYDDSELLIKLQTAKDRALALLLEVQLKDEALEEECREEFGGFYHDDITFTLKANQAASEAFNLSLIEKLFRDILIDIEQGKYFESFDELETDWAVAMKKYEKEAIGPGKFIALSQFSRKHQHMAFARYFQDIADKYEDQVAELRRKEKEYEDRLYATRKRDDAETKQLVLTHIAHLEKELGIMVDERQQLSDILGRVQYEISQALKKKKEEEENEEIIAPEDVEVNVKPKKKSNSKSCGCLLF